MITAVVFDLGGVLEIGDVIDKGVRPPWLKRLCQERDWGDGELESRLEAADLPGDPPHAELQDAYRRALGLSPAEFATFWGGWWDWYCGELNTELWEFITTELVGRFKLAILSNSGAGARVEEEARYGLSRVFDPIVYSHEIGVAKPDPRAFAELSQQIDLPYDQLCFVDDVPANLQAADGLGIHALQHVEGNTAEVVDDLRRLLRL